MSLSSLIVQREIASIREVEEALARQVLYGGDLVTNLLEVAPVDEAVLMAVVAESLGVAAAPAGELPRPSDEAKHLVAAEVARERNLAPLSVDRYGLTVAVAEPLAPDVEQELSFALALPIAQSVAPLVRIRQALARDYGLPLDRRLARLLARLTGGAPRRSSSFPSLRAPEVKAPPRPPSVAPPPSKIPARPRPSGAPGTLLRETGAPAARPSRRRRGPLTAEVARAELAEAAERDVIFDLVFEFARQYFDYTALFVVHGDVAEGRDAFGDGAPRDKVARIGVPLDLPGLLATARELKTVAKRVPAEDGIDPVLLLDLGRPGGTECVAVPIVVRTRVVALVFGDGGEGGVDAGSLADVQVVVAHAAAAFERLIVRRKLKGTVPPPGASSVPAPPTMVSEERPAVEELAPPIRELMLDPAAAAGAAREPSTLAGISEPKVALPPPRIETTPPPVNLLAVRRPSGPPIPREEPGERGEAAAEPSPSRAPGTRRRAEAPPLEFGSPPPSLLGGDGFAVDDVERRLLAEIQGRESDGAPSTTRDAAPPAVSDVPAASPRAESPPPMRAATATEPISGGPAASRVLSVTDLSPIDPLVPDPDATPLAPLVSELEPTPVAPAPAEVAPAPAPAPVKVSAPPPTTKRESKPMPPSEQQISVAPHRPPSSRVDRSSVLPSVIVDVSSEYVGLVQQLVEGPDEGAEATLIRAGGHAMPAIMARFPGPITIERDRLEDSPLPRVSDCGPVLRLVAGQRRTALPFVLAHVEDPDTDKRFWATFLLSELVYPDAVEAALRNVFDESPRVRRAARAAARAMAELHPGAVVSRLAEPARSSERSAEDRLLAVEALGETREPLAVPVLVDVLEAGSPQLVAAARAALVTVTRDDHGTDAERWRAWWADNKERHRLEWLIDALMHDQRALRAAASEELRAITKEFFGYHDDLPKRERERAQGRYRTWWNEVGRVRFNRDSARGS